MPVGTAPAEASSAVQPHGRKPHHPPWATRGVNCNPPVVIDANGIVHYKEACLK
jgi:hypothetical protein